MTPALRVLILDGQQRITSLYGITRGRPPAFFQGDEKAFSGLRFRVCQVFGVTDFSKFS